MALSEHGVLRAHDVLTLGEVAGLLKAAERTVYTMARQEEIPAVTVRGQWRFRRRDIDRWIDGQPRARAEEVSR